MSGYWKRLTDPDGTGVMLAPTVAVIGRLEAGEAPAAVASTLLLDPADLIALIALDAFGERVDDGPELVQAAPRRPGLAIALSEPVLAGLFPGATHSARLALSAGLLQVHDFWDLSHQAAQQADDLGEARFSAWWHGIAHRREPDAGNAAYWFRRVGRHPLFPSLARSTRPFLEPYPNLIARVMPGDSWDPFALIDLCTRPRGRNAELARMLQRLEMILACRVPRSPNEPYPTRVTPPAPHRSPRPLWERRCAGGRGGPSTGAGWSRSWW